jgi:restriction system protein
MPEAGYTASTATPTWPDDYREFFRAPKVSEPDYEVFRFYSKFGVIDGSYEFGGPAATYFKTNEIKSILSRSIIDDPFELFWKDYSAPLIEANSLPPKPADPRQYLRNKPRHLPSPPKLRSLPTKPSYTLVQPASLKLLGLSLTLLNKVLTRGQQREADEQFSKKLQKWESETRIIQANNDDEQKLFEQRNDQDQELFERGIEEDSTVRLFEKVSAYWDEQNVKLQQRLDMAQKRWNTERLSFLDKSAAEGDLILQLKSDVQRGDVEAIQSAALIALGNSEFQTSDAGAHYDGESNILLVDYCLPDIETIPIIENMNFNSNGKAKAISVKNLTELHDTILYGLVLGAAYDFAVIFSEAPVGSIVINGWLTRIDPATGNERSDVTMSLLATKEQLLELNIEQCDPRAAFKSLKGMSGVRPHEYTPVQPVYMFAVDDERIVEGRTVLSGVSDQENLGAMHWDDFEHLIREVFELEFAKSGAEVKVTRASRDSGVDAIVFDPDPIRGGKIVLQAKRYVNTVDVSAVRDLFGTIQNEGANKGILITTSGFGGDSYEFAKGKPITLMNGQNLLWLLEKHGRKFVIDLPQARKILKDRGWL